LVDNMPFLPGMIHQADRILSVENLIFHENRFMSLAMVFGSVSSLIVSKNRVLFLAVRQFAAEENPKSRCLEKLYNDSFLK